MTPKQTEVYNYLLAYFKKNGFLPSQSLVRKEFNFSPQRAMQYFDIFVEQGLLEKTERTGYYVIPR
jgi:hypothetical protein